MTARNPQRLGNRRTLARPGEGSPEAHHPRKRSNHRTIYAAGEIIPESGIYEVVHKDGHRAVHESVLVKGDAFPHCDACADRVRFRVVRTAPYIFHDDDFGDE